MVFADLPAERGVDAVLDVLVGDAAFKVTEPHALERSCNLRDQPALSVRVLNEAKEYCVTRQLGSTPRLKALAQGTQTFGNCVVGKVSFRTPSRTRGPSVKPFMSPNAMVEDERCGVQAMTRLEKRIVDRSST